MTGDTWLCTHCRTRSDDDELLRAPHPFIEEDSIWGCPNCRETDNITRACDEEGCLQEASAGTPTQEGGYTWRCSSHPYIKRKPQEAT